MTTTDDRHPVRQIAQRLCPHWYWPVPVSGRGSERFETVKHERCKLCGHHRTHARVLEPAWPSQTRADLRETMEQPGQKLVVVEWKEREE